MASGEGLVLSGIGDELAASTPGEDAPVRVHARLSTQSAEPSEACPVCPVV